MLIRCRSKRLFVVLAVFLHCIAPTCRSLADGLIRYIMMPVVLCFAVSVQAERLTDPALVTPRTTSSLLLDITKAGNRLVAVGDQGVILLSDTDGQQWQQAAVPTSVMLTAVTFVTDSEGWAVGHDGVLLHTVDAGVSWTVAMTGNDLNALQVEQYQALVDADGDSAMPDLPTDELALYLDDAQVAQEDGPSLALLNLYFSDPQNGFLLGAYGLLLATADGGGSWQVRSHRVPNVDRFHLNAMTSDGRYLYVAGEAGVLFRSADKGEHWETLSSPYEGSFFDISTYQDALLLAGLRGHLFISQDQGDTWEPVTVDTPSTLSVLAVDASKAAASVLVAGQGGSILVGEDIDALRLLDQSDRRAWSAAASVHDGWVLVGEKGFKLINQQGDAVASHANEHKDTVMRVQP